MNKKAREASVEDLAEELFHLVQQPQGFFYVSDGEGFGMTKDQFFERIRGRLAWGKKAVLKMRAFLRKYGEDDE